ncbi:MAG: TIGR01777 family oxidoreductase [Acidobacteriota bacterium]|nr:TIGR01777 family oxidoreductase [Acidobacteriota bacterium]MDH3785011.1 TIGR01777 family oxidoreductase [Acidobacteriota bacterium]
MSNDDRHRVAITGASGLVGRALCRSLSTTGHDVVRLVRRQPTAADEVLWNPATEEIDGRALEGIDAVVHLAGESVAGRRWTDPVKKRIRDSRVLGTRLLVRTLAGLDRPPAVLVSASATGFYGDRGDETLDETSDRGEGFLADVCGQWEAETDVLAQRGVRVVIPRLGVVLAGGGGALTKMLLPFRLGLGGRLGSGHQWMSWVGLEDLVGMLQMVIRDLRIDGVFNAVSPEPCTNREFTRTLGRVLGRPTLLPVPAFLLRWVAGEMADELLLAGARVYPRRLMDLGFEYRQSNIEETLRSELGRRRPEVS